MGQDAIKGWGLSNREGAQSLATTSLVPPEMPSITPDTHRGAGI